VRIPPDRAGIAGRAIITVGGRCLWNCRMMPRGPGLTSITRRWCWRCGNGTDMLPWIQRDFRCCATCAQRWHVKFARRLTHPCPRTFPRRIWLADVRQDEVLFQLVTRGSPEIVGLEGGWAAVVRAIAERVLEDWQADGKIPGQTPFRETRQPRFAHPMSLAAPALARWLDMPRVALPGDRTTPRTQTAGLSASQRMPGPAVHAIRWRPEQ
jgi:hypothetical protein